MYKAMKVEEAPIPQHWKDTHKAEWAVIEGSMVYQYVSTQEEAEKIAKLINKAVKVSNDIEDYAEDQVNELTEEEKVFLRDYVGKIEIEI